MGQMGHQIMELWRRPSTSTEHRNQENCREIRACVRNVHFPEQNVDGWRRRHLRGWGNECVNGEIMDAFEDEMVIFEHGLFVLDSGPRY